MTTPRPPQEPLDAQEREFARILRALPGGEPPAALDAAILRAATNAAASSRRPGARVLASMGALWGVGSAAAAVLAIGVFWHLRYGVDRAPAGDQAPRVQAVSEVAEDSAVQVDLGAPAAEAQADAAPPPAAAPPLPVATAPAAKAMAPPARARQEAFAPAPPPPPMMAAPEPFAADALDEHVARDASAEGKAEVEMDREQAGTRELAAKNVAAQPAPAAAAAQSRADTGNAVGGMAAPQESAPKKPATWLAEIRVLRDAGRIEEARARLVEFRRQYPNWVIPTDLAPLLSE